MDKIICKYMNYQYIVFLIVAVTVCPVLSGCGGQSPAQVILQTEEEQPISFMHNHADGMEIARQEKKPILAFFSVPNNVGSQRMINTTFCDEEIKRLAKRFICIYVDGSQESMLCKSLGISSFPTILLSNTNGMEVHRLIGGQTPDQLAIQMHVILQSTALRPQMSIGR